jgi:hypothetical protein
MQHDMAGIAFEFVGAEHSFVILQHHPHPEERRSRVSKDEATGRATWFEMPLARLLTMRIRQP